MALGVMIDNAWQWVTAAISNGSIWQRVQQAWVKINSTWQPVWRYNWATSDWGGCSAACAGGTQTRVVTCLRDDGVPVADSICEATVSGKPPTSQVCNTQPCPVCNYFPDRPRYVWAATINGTYSFLVVTVNGVIKYNQMNRYPDSVTQVTGVDGKVYTRGPWRAYGDCYNCEAGHYIKDYEVCYTP